MPMLLQVRNKNNQHVFMLLVNRQEALKREAHSRRNDYSCACYGQLFSFDRSGDLIEPLVEFF